jgi:hypothetical protein
MLKGRYKRIMYLKELKVVLVVMIALSVLVTTASAAPTADSFE